MTPAEHAEKHFPEYLEKLKKLVRIPSISFDGYSKEEVERSAKAVAELLKDEGLENIEILRGNKSKHPYVYGDWLHAPNKPTLLLYAHHDVQPVGQMDKWKSKPFEPTERDGRLFARGAADDKAGVIVHSSAIASFLKTTGKLPLNVKVLIEGEEEVGSSGLEDFLKNNVEKLRADAIVLTDTGNFDVGVPTITTSLRGLVAIQLEVRALRQSVHSGAFGGPAVDPILALSKMLATLVDNEGRIAIPGIYDDVRALTALERQSIDKLHYTDDKFRKEAGVLEGVQLVGGPENPLVKMFRLPSISVNAIQASSRKEVANVINESVWCKVGIRTVPNMNNEKVLKLLMDHLKKVTPWGVKVEVTPDSMGPWWVTQPEGKAFELAAKALSKAFGRETVFLGCGGSIPFVEPFSKMLGGVPALLIGVEDPHTNAHSENESVHLGDLKKSILGAIYCYEELAHGLK